MFVCFFFFLLTISEENLRTGLIEPTALEQSSTGTDRNHIWFCRNTIINNIGSTLGHNYFSQCYWWLSLLSLSCTKVPLLYSSQNCNYLNSVCSFSLPHTLSSYYHQYFWWFKHQVTSLHAGRGHRVCLLPLAVHNLDFLPSYCLSVLRDCSLSHEFLKMLRMNKMASKALS